MEGFFSALDIVDKFHIPGEKNKRKDCFTCGLFRNCRSPKMLYSGEGRKKILIVCEAPGGKEDRLNTQLIGDVGVWTRERLKKIGYILDRDFWKTNAIICRPPGNRKPTNAEIQACRVNLINTIEKTNPKGIILFGAAAFKSLLGEKISKYLTGHKFSDFIGQCIPDQVLKMWIGVMYHPSFIIRMEDISLENIWMNDLKGIIAQCRKPFYDHNYKSDIIVLKDREEAIKVIKGFNDNDDFVFAEDFETTGIKPHRKGHEIKTISISNGIISVAFPNFKDKNFQELFKVFQKRNNIKIAHNYNFESMWNKTVLNFSIGGQSYDTIIAAHCYKNKMRVGLKFLSYIFFGVLGYDCHVEKWIKKRKKGEREKSDNAFNMIDGCNLNELLLYNGMDSLLTYRLYEFFERHLLPFQKKGFELLNEGNYWLLKAQQAGIKIDLDLLEKTKKEIKNKLIQLEKEIRKAPELKKWDWRKPFNFDSSKDFTHLIKDILKMKIKDSDLTATGEVKRDKNVLHKYKLSFIESLLDWKRWDKSTDYIDQIDREVVNGVIHPFFNLYTTVTFRSSSSSFNFQNIPKHDEEIKKMIRSLIIPRGGNRLVDWDFKQLEVCISACYNKDPVLIDYILNPASDMHKDQAELLFIRNDVDSVERFVAKNDFVFAEFYGDWYKKIAPNLWEHMPNYTKKHLKECGIENYFDFEAHVKDIEQKLWEKFHVYAEWKDKLCKEYEKKGYIDSYTGFRYYGPMKRNKLCNYPIQGSAFHCLLWLFIMVSRELKKLKIKRSFFIGQIHDDAVGDVHPDDEELFDSLIFEYGTKKIREHWDWIIVPLKIEKERSAINGNWSEMENCGILNG